MSGAWFDVYGVRLFTGVWFDVYKTQIVNLPKI